MQGPGMKVLVPILVSILLREASAKDLMLGTTGDSNLIWQETVRVGEIPIFHRFKDVAYFNPSQRRITGVVARDLDRNDSICYLTSGGPGFTFVRLRCKSERGHGLNYILEIFA